MTHNSPETITADSYTQHLHNILEWMPVPTLIADIHGNVLEANAAALNFIGIKPCRKSIGDFHLKHFIVDHTKALALIMESVSKNATTPQSYLVRLPGQVYTSVVLSARIFPGGTKIILIQFTESNHRARLIFSEMAYTFRREVSTLKPYLNKPGKELLEQILAGSTPDSINRIKPLAHDNTNTIQDQRHKGIAGMFPGLSASELSLCSLLSLNMSVNEIAAFTGKSSNCLRVTLHRILRKTNSASTKEFLKKIELPDNYTT